MIAAPRPYPDELISSALVRCCRWYDLPFKVFARRVLNLPELRLNFLSIWPLRALEPLFNLPAEELLLKHTTFQYASAFISPSSHTGARLLALDGGANTSQLTAVMQNASVGVVHRRMCLRCVEEDLIEFGESYWHCTHNLPGVLMCPKHHCRLVGTALQAVAELRTIYKLPIECEACSLQIARTTAAMWKLALRSEQVLHRPDAPGPVRDPAFYRQLAIAKGWLSAQRPVQQDRLVKAVEACFPADLMSATGLRHWSDSAWPALAFRPGARFNLTTVKHLALEVTLSSVAVAGPTLNYVPTGPPPSSGAKLDAFYAAQVQHELHAALSSGQVLSTRELLQRAGALGAYRHRASEMPRLRKVVLQFRASPATTKRLRAGSVLFRSRPTEAVPMFDRSPNIWQQQT